MKSPATGDDWQVNQSFAGETALVVLCHLCGRDIVPDEDCYCRIAPMGDDRALWWACNSCIEEAG